MGLFDKFKKEKKQIQAAAESRPKVFEDEFSEVQTGLISLCMELIRIKVDKVFAYCSIEDNSQAFNAFFEKDDKILKNNQVGASMETVNDFLRLGNSDLDKLREICATYGKPVPRQIKMVYDANTHGYDARISYDSLLDEGKSAGKAFMEWRNEVENKNQAEDRF